MQRTAYELRISDWSSYVSSSDLLGAVEERLKAARRLGPVAPLMPTTAATTIRKSREPVVLDGPFAETKAPLLGFTQVECESLETALETAKECERDNAPGVSYQISTVYALTRYGPGAEAQ